MMILTREQLEDRLAALHQASLELVKDISPEPLLERIAALACEQVQARYAAVGVIGKHGELAQFITVGMTPEEMAKLEHPPVGLGLIGALMRSHETIRLPEIEADARSVGFPPNHPYMHSFLGVPIHLGETQLGQIYLTDKIGASEFNPDDELVIETLAAYAAIAISNARLYEELRQRDIILTRRNEDLALLNDLASTLASSPEVDEILDKALSRVVSSQDVGAGEVFLREENGRSLRLVLHRGSTDEPLWTQDRFPTGEGMVGLAATSGKPLFLIIPTKNERFLRKSVVKDALHQIACFPLTARSGVLGVLCVATSHGKVLDDREIQLFSAIGSWVGTAIENVRLNLQDRRLAILEERERIGMDLHDGIIQSIYAVGLTLEHARLLMDGDKQQASRRIDQAVSDLNSTIRDIRTYILDLRPRQLHEENLISGIERLVNEFHANTQADVALRGPSDGLSKLPDNNAIALFHICQEALANVAKHAHAHKVSIVLWASEDRALMEISDDGRGFDAQKMNLTIGHGLANIQTRAHAVGGDVEITSEPNEGTTILAWVPLTDETESTSG
ncbi:MAG: GAF domain-containing sensor histidine kinase [Chloroflexi bacterium]|nr:GAF domain-containing sensor histidine kinase [Chloroflexota bacterium]